MTAADWRLEDVSGLRFARCPAIEAVSGVAHAFGTRWSAGSVRFDLGRADDDTRETVDRRRLLLRAAGCGSARPAILRQVHGADIVGTTDWPDHSPAADGVMRVVRDDPSGRIPAVATADCVPVLVVDRSGVVVAALHAGWRGVAAGIGVGALNRFADAGVPPADVVVALGPAIGGCCYEVGDEVVRALEATCGRSRTYVLGTPNGRPRVDLRGALRAQLVAAGVPDGSIHTAPWCTRCRTDLFFSFRAEGHAAGRMLSVIGPAAPP